jgi:hypothetical protein
MATHMNLLPDPFVCLRLHWCREDGGSYIRTFTATPRPASPDADLPPSLMGMYNPLFNPPKPKGAVVAVLPGVKGPSPVVEDGGRIKAVLQAPVAGVADTHHSSGLAPEDSAHQAGLHGRKQSLVARLMMSCFGSAPKAAKEWRTVQ